MESLLLFQKKEERRMKLINHEWLRAGRWMTLLSMAIGLMGMGLGREAQAQSVTTTTVQGTVYLANGQPGSGTLVLSWSSFTTASGSYSGPGDAGAGASAIDAGGASSADGESNVCPAGDRGAFIQYADGLGRDDDGTVELMLRSDAGFTGRGQALC